MSARTASAISIAASFCIALGACAGSSANHPTTTRSLEPGEYRLTLSATEGPRAGKTARGALTLVRTAATDSSPRTGEGPHAKEDRARNPLYGFSDLDFDAVSVAASGDEDIPPPSSTDPIYPGVLALDDIIGGERWFVLLVGTARNLRTGRVSLDGPGIALWIEHIEGPHVWGTWSSWGIVRTGSGTWSAVRE